jgi:nicotinate-nucleotide pyrophosphorylase (carboxylating)
MINNKIPLNTIQQQVDKALDEDLGNGDITSSLINSKAQATAELIIRESAILCGSQWFEQAFKLLDSNISIQWQAIDGDKLKENQIVCTILGPAASILSAERTALNFLQTLSATATITRHYADFLLGTNIRLLDTRKTIPGLRAAQKYAVTCGGGFNHRHGLFDGVLIKENHIIAAGGIKQAVTQAKNIIAHGLKIEVEVETLEEVEQALDANADILLLDNMSIDMLNKAVSINKNHAKHQALLEVSGDITDKKLAQLSNIDIDFISVGSLTKHIRAIDFSLRFNSF